MTDLCKYYDINKKKWNEYAELHYKGEGYEVAKFIKEREGLHPLEIKEVGDVTNRTLLHLQCHFGKDTLSWVLRGAKQAVGIDFSEKAILFAKELAELMNLKAEFINCDFYMLKDHLDQKFDFIFTSYGAICWLHDLKEWANIIYDFLKPEGFFYIVDGHPTAMMFDDVSNNNISVKYPYFTTQKPIKFDNDGSYADPNAKITNKVEYSWNHSLSEIINSLITAGLKIEFLHEHTKIPWRLYQILEEKEKGWWTFPKNWQNREFPLLFSIKATKK